ncbi:MAG TPA: ComEA family DNA-binding protein [Tenericutes bacterium]|jgi:competence protein ComEA|nr:ComEA family DNA-binding protein [Mycoplasmatota bacterium]
MLIKILFLLLILTGCTKETIVEKLEEEKIIAGITGEVVNPGIYELESNSKISDLVFAAGGFTENANKENINLDESLKNFEIINVSEIIVKKEKEKEEVKPQEEKKVVKTEPKEDKKEEKKTETSSTKISINYANQKLLETLPGIGPAKAKAIIEYRNTHGLFKDISEIMNVKGIGKAIYEKIKDFITL